MRSGTTPCTSTALFPGAEGAAFIRGEQKMQVPSDWPAAALQTGYIPRHVCFQGVGGRMTVLVVFLVVVLGCSLAEGRLVSKCELKEQLINKGSEIKPNLDLTVGNRLAKSE